MNSPDDSPMGRLSRALAAAAPSRAVLDALTGELPPVAPGQLWRARRGARSLLVLVSASSRATVDVSPVTIDEASDADAVNLPAAASTIAAPLTVWLDLTRTVPMRTLEQYTGHLTRTVNVVGGGAVGTDVLAWVARKGRPGAAVVAPTDPAAVFRARLVDTLDEFADAPVPVGSGELPSILKRIGIGRGELAALLLVTTGVALQVWRGLRALTVEEAERLAPRVDRDPEELLHANPAPPEPLLTWMSQPAQRRKVVALANKHKVDEDTAFTHATYSTLALAARATGDRDPDLMWAALGQRYFESVLEQA